MSDLVIEVFKTDVQEWSQAGRLTALLLEYFPGSRINFDLEDCDRVLRVEGTDFRPDKVVAIIMQNGFSCTPLE